MAEKNKILSIVVGCGGSGVTTMIALNRLLAENPDMRDRINREIFYIAVDTETTMLNKFSTEVEKQMCGAKMPLIESILLSKDVNVLNSVIHPYFEKPFERSRDPKILAGLERLKTNWWFDKGEDGTPGAGAPFRAPLVSNLLLGAGQCPPASYCLAWSKLGQIEASIRNIVSAIKRRGSGDPDVLTHLNIFVVAGLSGGTGRGCWNLITFKIRQCFENEGVSIAPVGVFFGAKVFENVSKKKGPAQARAIRVNALTGLSELSCWMSTGRDQSKGKFVYRLPDMRQPANEKTDVLNTEVGISPVSGAPVDSAYLICGPSKSSHLTDNAQFHEMAGAGLYAMITNSDLSGERVNNSNPYNSFAAITFEIDALRLQGYFETIVQGVALDGLKTCDDDVEARVKAFLSEVPMAVEVHGKDDLLPAGEGSTIVQAAAAEILAQNEGAFKSLLEDLPTMTPDEAEEEAVSRVEEILASVTDHVVSGAVRKAISEKLGGADPLEKVKKAVSALYKGEKKERRSVGRVRKFMDTLLTKVSAAADGSLEGFEFDDPSGATAGKVGPREYIVSYVRQLSGRTWAEKLKFGKPFNREEVGNLVKKSGRTWSGAVPESVLYVSYGRIRKAIEAFFKPTKDYVKNLVDACDRFAKICDRARTMLENDAPIAAGGKTGDDPFKLLFAPSGDVESALPAMDSPTLAYRRILRPIFENEQAVRELLLKEGNMRIEDGMEAFVRKAIDSEKGDLLRLGSADADTSAESRFTKDLVDAVRANVSMDDRFLEREFSFYKVLERNIPHWNKRLQELRGNRSRFADLSVKFEKLLGAEPERDPVTGEFHLPEADELLLSISSSMARNCAPWWVTDVNPDSDHYTVKVFLPERKDKFRNGDMFEEDLQATLDFANVEVAWPDDKNTGVTPFSVIAFTADSVPELDDTEIANGMHPLDKVRSLDDYRDADTNKWLGWAEDPNGRSIFEMRHNNKGIGYVSPLFVRVPELATARWRPWSPVEKNAGANRDFALEAMRYGFLGTGISDEDRKTLSDLLGPVADLPLLRLVEKGQKYQILRKPYALDKEGNAAPNRKVAWTASEAKPRTLCTSLCNLYTYLQGLGKVGLDGKATEKDVEEGNQLRVQLLAEKEAFVQTFKKDLGAKVFRSVVKARDEWFQSKLAEADKNDKPVWEKLLSEEED